MPTKFFFWFQKKNKWNRILVISKSESKKEFFELVLYFKKYEIISK